MGNTSTLLGFGIYLLCRSTQLHHQNKLASSSDIQNTVFAKMNRHVQSCHETVMIDPVTFETSDGVLPLHPLLCEVIIKFYTLAKVFACTPTRLTKSFTWRRSERVKSPRSKRANSRRSERCTSPPLPQHRGPGCCRTNRRRCTSHRPLRSTPRCALFVASAPSR